jgi:hypothetical protein
MMLEMSTKDSLWKKLWIMNTNDSLWEKFSIYEKKSFIYGKRFSFYEKKRFVCEKFYRLMSNNDTFIYSNSQ